MLITVDPRHETSPDQSEYDGVQDNDNNKDGHPPSVALLRVNHPLQVPKWCGHHIPNHDRQGGITKVKEWSLRGRIAATTVLVLSSTSFPKLVGIFQVLELWFP